MIVDRLCRAARRLRTRLESHAVILLYHRVGEGSVDPWRLAVRPAHLAQHLDVLGRVAHPMSLAALVAALDAGRCPRRAVAVTFDDGYADNLELARPLLARHDVPATVFVTSGALGGGREFWWDELERLLLSPGELPPTLHLRIGGRHHARALGTDATWDVHAPLRHPGWQAWDDDHPTARHLLYRELYDLLFAIPASERRQVLDALAAWAGASVAPRRTHRPLVAAELGPLGADGLVEIGAHTVTHPVLAALPLCQQRDEIGRARDALEALLDRPVVSFAYPFGRRCDYTAETVALVHEAGFASACANVAGLVGRRSARLELPRLQVRDWDGDRFAANLDHWLAGELTA